MEANLDTDQLKEKYSKFTDDELRKEYNDIRSIPNARTNIEALTRLAVLLPVMESRGIEGMKSQNRPSYEEPESSANVGGIILGLLLIIGGIALSAGTGRIFYGAVLVGIGILFKSMM